MTRLDSAWSEGRTPTPGPAVVSILDQPRVGSTRSSERPVQAFPVEPAVESAPFRRPALRCRRCPDSPSVHRQHHPRHRSTHPPSRQSGGESSPTSDRAPADARPQSTDRGRPPEVGSISGPQPARPPGRLRLPAAAPACVSSATSDAGPHRPEAGATQPGPGRSARHTSDSAPEMRDMVRPVPGESPGAP